MPRIPSANQDFPLLPLRSPVQYRHPAANRRGRIPVAFQVSSPFGYWRPLLPHALVMHVNPSNFQITHNKLVERIQTRGGWVEQHWGDQLDEISCNGSTGAFMNIYTGLTSVLRQRTIAWDRFRDLHDLYRNNGSIYDPSGKIVLQGQIMLLYDQGTYIGTFRTFEFEETAESPFSFNVSWTFKVEHTIWQVGPRDGNPVWGPSPRVPSFQGRNALEAPNAVASSKAIEDANRLKAQQAFVQGFAERGITAAKDVVKSLWENSAIGQYMKQRAEQQAALRQERQAQMREALGAPTPQEVYDQQRAEFGLPPKDGIPTESDPAVQLGLGRNRNPRSL